MGAVERMILRRGDSNKSVRQMRCAKIHQILADQISKSADGLARICFNMALKGSHMGPQVFARVEGFANRTSTLSACLVTCLSHAMSSKQGGWRFHTGP